MTEKSKLWDRIGHKRPDPATAEPKPLPLILPPCPHEGPVLASCTSCGGGESHHTRACAIHGQCTRAPTSDRTLKVCRSCDEHPARASAEFPHSPPSPGWVRVPEPPPLNLRPTNRTAVVTVAAGDAGRELLAVSGPPMERFARRVGADFVVLDWPGHASWPMSAKFAIPTALDHYGRILYADADVLFRDGCVNPFDLCRPDEFGAADELPWQLVEPYRSFGVLKNYDRARREHGLHDGREPSWYCNMGVYVCPRELRHLIERPLVPVRPYHCGEQDLINARILSAARTGTAKVRLLDRRANWQNWTDTGFRHAPPDAVLHWSGAGHDRARRVADMKLAANA